MGNQQQGWLVKREVLMGEGLTTAVKIPSSGSPPSKGWCSPLVL